MTIWPELDLRRLELWWMRREARDLNKLIQHVEMECGIYKYNRALRGRLTILKNRIYDLDEELFIEKTGVTCLPAAKHQERHQRSITKASNELKALKLYKAGKYKEALALLA